MSGRGVVVVGLVSVPAIVGIAMASPLVGIVGPLVAVLAWAERGRRRRRRAALARAEALPGLVDHLIQRLRSGGSLTQACRSLGGGDHAQVDLVLVDHGLADLVGALDEGATLSEATGVLVGSPDPSVRLVGVTLAVLAANGGPAVPALRRLRHTLTGRVHRARRAEAQAAQALASASLLTLAPAAVATVLSGIEPDLGRFYLHDPLGAGCAAAAVVLSAGGWWWMQRVVDRLRPGHR